MPGEVQLKNRQLVPLAGVQTPPGAVLRAGIHAGGITNDLHALEAHGLIGQATYRDSLVVNRAAFKQEVSIFKVEFLIPPSI